jgi:hypothetical protein
MMKVHTRMMFETMPEVKQMANEIKHRTGKSIKEIIEKLIQ